MRRERPRDDDLHEELETAPREADVASRCNVRHSGSRATIYHRNRLGKKVNASVSRGVKKSGSILVTLYRGRGLIFVCLQMHSTMI